MARDDFAEQLKQTLAKRVGHRCSNPNCRKLTAGPADRPNASVNIGVAAHIHAASPGGPRFDSSMSGQQRSDIDNAIWLCQNCAKLIDSDEARYSITVLRAWRTISEEAARFEVENLTADQVASLVPSSIVMSVNQSGGQTAHTIVNNAPLQRKLGHLRERLVQALSPLAPQDYVIRLPSGDAEVDRIAHELDSTLEQCGWQRKGFKYIMAGCLPPGIEIAVDGANEPRLILLNELSMDSSLLIRGNTYSNIVGVIVTVGPHPESVRGVTAS